MTTTKMVSVLLMRMKWFHRQRMRQPSTKLKSSGLETETSMEAGNYEVFYNTDGLVQGRNIDLTHLYIFNTSSADSNEWGVECLSLNWFYC